MDKVFVLGFSYTNVCLLGLYLVGQAWSWSYDSWIYSYLCNQCLSTLTLWVRTPLRWGVLDSTLCDKVCQWLAASQWFSLCTPVSSTNKTDRHDNIAKILWKVMLNTIRLTPVSVSFHNMNTSLLLGEVYSTVTPIPCG